MATPVFCCGFECGVSGAHWGIGTNGVSFSTTTVRSGARSLRTLDPSSGSGGTTQLFNNLTSVDTMVVRLYVRFAALPLSNVNIVGIRSGLTLLASAQFTTADSKIYAGGDGVSATGISVTTGQWYRIDLRFVASTDVCDLQVDGVAVQNDGARAGLGTPNNIVLCQAGASWTGEIFIDDVLISQTSADYPWGGGYINHFIPVADGTHNVAGANDFERSATGVDITNATTDAYTLIDDVPLKSGSITEYINAIAPPNSSDYVEVVFGPAPGISTPTVAPRAVEGVVAAAKGTGTGANSFSIALTEGAATVGFIAASANVTATSPTAQYWTLQMPLAGFGNPWTVTPGSHSFNEIRARMTVLDAAPDPWWASIMVEAEFPEAAPGPIPNRLKLYQRAAVQTSNTI